VAQKLAVAVIAFVAADDVSNGLARRVLSFAKVLKLMHRSGLWQGTCSLPQRAGVLL
jgi:hypothetical protein